MKISSQQLTGIGIWIIPLSGVSLAGFNIWKPYSYWLDELYSITTSSLGFADMFRSLLTDVHPPLYQVLLWIWMHIFGDYEPVSRGFSLICSLSSLAYLYCWSKRLDKWSRVITLSFFATSWLFIYYAQETRSYALLLFLSTLLTGLFTSDNNSHKSFIRIVFIAMLLGSTHYFGLILSSSVLCWLFIQNIKNPIRVLVLFAAVVILLIWPLTEYVYGTLDNKTGGKFWIQINGPIDTLTVFIQSIIGLIKWKSPLNIALTLLGIGFVLTLLSYRFNLVKRGIQIPDQTLILKLLFCLISLISIVIIIDLHTPISTERNYIVLLPSVSILVGLSFGILTQLRYGFVGVLVVAFTWAGMQLDYSYNLLIAKWSPVQNWKASAEYLVKNADGQALYYLRLTDSNEISRIFNYYVNRLSNGTISVEPIYASMLSKVSSPSMVLVGGVAANTVSQIETTEKIKIKRIIYPTQSWENSTGILLF
jgi:uncharacterized membrane protein